MSHELDNGPELNVIYFIPGDEGIPNKEWKIIGNTIERIQGPPIDAYVCRRGRTWTWTPRGYDPIRIKVEIDDE